ncbi:MAG: radical SAM protein, partial [Pseudomonadota bacterium]
DLVGISVHSGLGFTFARQLMARVRSLGIPVVVGGPFASTCPEAFVNAGADHVVVGEGEEALPALLDTMKAGRRLPGRVIRAAPVADPDSLAHPAYDLIRLEPYYEAGRAHGPLCGPYLPLVTSRGCPHSCAFCAAPFLGGGKWRPRDPDKVADEVRAMQRRYGVQDFHVQDDNCTASRERAASLFRATARLSPCPGFCLCSGIRSDDVSGSLLETMAKGGVRHVSFSPESGSPRVRALMKKQVDVPHLLDMVRIASRLGLGTQACFILGFPGETGEDRGMTRGLIRRLVARGLDDVSLFIMAPVPGSACEGTLGPVPEYEGLSWSPSWRPDYPRLQRARTSMYLEFFLRKLVHHPARFLAYFARALSGRYRNKGEMVIGSLVRRFAEDSGLRSRHRARPRPRPVKGG